MDKVSLGNSLTMGIPGLGDPQRDCGDSEQSLFPAGFRTKDHEGVDGC